MHTTDGVTTIELTVRYGETDQMGVAYHGHYLAWCDMARTDHLRRQGVRYRDLEAGGLLLAVTDARVRYRGVVRYDDRVRVRCWVREAVSRGITFGYAFDQIETGQLVATAQTTLMALDSDHARIRIPPEIRAALAPTADPVRL